MSIPPLDSLSDPDFLAINSLFKAGVIKSFRLLEEQAPTKVSKSLGLNYNSYLEKLRNPEKFSVSQVISMGFLFAVSPELIFNLIEKEAAERVKSKLLEKLNKL